MTLPCCIHSHSYENAYENMPKNLFSMEEMEILRNSIKNNDRNNVKQIIRRDTNKSQEFHVQALNKPNNKDYKEEISPKNNINDEDTLYSCRKNIDCDDFGSFDHIPSQTPTPKHFAEYESQNGVSDSDLEYSAWNYCHEHRMNRRLTHSIKIRSCNYSKGSYALQNSLGRKRIASIVERSALKCPSSTTITNNNSLPRSFCTTQFLKYLKINKISEIDD